MYDLEHLLFKVTHKGRYANNEYCILGSEHTQKINQLWGEWDGHDGK